MEHSGVVEMVVHLSRYDVIFISVSKSDHEFLSAEDGAHMLGFLNCRLQSDNPLPTNM